RAVRPGRLSHQRVPDPGGLQPVRPRPALQVGQEGARVLRERRAVRGAAQEGHLGRSGVRQAPQGNRGETGRRRGPRPRRGTPPEGSRGGWLPEEDRRPGAVPGPRSRGCGEPGRRTDPPACPESAGGNAESAGRPAGGTAPRLPEIIVSAGRREEATTPPTQT